MAAVVRQEGRSAPAPARSRENAGSDRTGLQRRRPDSFSVANLIQLQTFAGNRAVSKLLATSAQVPGASSDSEMAAGRAERGPIALRPTGARQTLGRSPLASGSGTSLEEEIGRPTPSAVSSGVRVHTGGDADEMSEALGAEGFTHGQDIFLSSRHYQRGSTDGHDLLAHEAHHATSPHASTGQIHLKRQKMYLDFLRIKKRETHIGRMLGSMALEKLNMPKLAKKLDTRKTGESYDHYGHWWIEAGKLGDTDDLSTWAPAESYGWWPARKVNIAQTLKIKRVEGKLNKGRKGDPHQGDPADTEYHPVMEVDETEPYEQVRDRVMGDVRNFANSFSGSWNWRLAWGKNCHVFIDRLKAALGLHHQAGKGWLRGEGVEDEEKKKADEQAAEQSKPLEFEGMRKLLVDLGLVGIGVGVVDQAKAIAAEPRLKLEEMKKLTDRQLGQLMADINKNQGFMRAEPGEVNDLFSALVGEKVDLFKPEHDGATTDESTPTSEDTTSGGANNESVSNTETTPQTEVNPLPQVLTPEGRSKLEGMVWAEPVLAQPLIAGSVRIEAGEKILIMKVLEDGMVQVQREHESGTHKVAGAALLAALE